MKLNSAKPQSDSCHEGAKLDNTCIQMYNQKILSHIYAYINNSYAQDIKYEKE
jgi:hypothetical protein